MTTHTRAALDRIRAEFAEPVAVQGQERTFRFCIATENPVETMLGPEYLRMAGVDLGRFEKNPVVVDSHDVCSIRSILGKAKVWVEGKRMMADITLDPTPEGDAALARVKSGSLRATSIRFRPASDGVDQLRAGDVEDEMRGPAVVVRKSSLLEVTLCAVPADPDTVRRSLRPSRVRNEQAEIEAMGQEWIDTMVSDGAPEDVALELVDRWWSSTPEEEQTLDNFIAYLDGEAIQQLQQFMDQEDGRSLRPAARQRATFTIIDHDLKEVVDVVEAGSMEALINRLEEEGEELGSDGSGIDIVDGSFSSYQDAMASVGVGDSEAETQGEDGGSSWSEAWNIAYEWIEEQPDPNHALQHVNEYLGSTSFEVDLDDFHNHLAQYAGVQEEDMRALGNFPEEGSGPWEWTILCTYTDSGETEEVVTEAMTEEEALDNVAEDGVTCEVLYKSEPGGGDIVEDFRSLRARSITTVGQGEWYYMFLISPGEGDDQKELEVLADNFDEAFVLAEENGIEGPDEALLATDDPDMNAGVDTSMDRLQSLRAIDEGMIAAWLAGFAEVYPDLADSGTLADMEGEAMAWAEANPDASDDEVEAALSSIENEWVNADSLDPSQNEDAFDEMEEERTTNAANRPRSGTMSKKDGGRIRYSDLPIKERLAIKQRALAKLRGRSQSNKEDPKLAAMRQRRAEDEAIRSLVKGRPDLAEVAEDCILEGLSLDKARAAILAARGKKQAPGGTPDAPAPDADQTRAAGSGTGPELNPETVLRMLTGIRS